MNCITISVISIVLIIGGSVLIYFTHEKYKKNKENGEDTGFLFYFGVYGALLIISGFIFFKAFGFSGNASCQSFFENIKKIKKRRRRKWRIQ